MVVHLIATNGRLTAAEAKSWQHYIQQEKSRAPIKVIVHTRNDNSCRIEVTIPVPVSMSPDNFIHAFGWLKREGKLEEDWEVGVEIFN